MTKFSNNKIIINWQHLGRVLVIIDAANLVKSVDSFAMRVHNRKLIRFFQQYNKLIGVRYYTVSVNGKRFSDFAASMERYGYYLITKPLKKIFDRKKQKIIPKANFDVEIAVDVMDYLAKFDTLILFSGDSDFNYLILRLKIKGKKVLVFSTRYHVAHELVENCDRYFDIREFREVFLRPK